MRRLIGIIAVVITVLFLVPIISIADDGATCGISVNSTIDFGNLTPNGISSDKTITITNNGTFPTTNLTIEGDNWSTGIGMSVTQTHWALFDSDYGSMNELNTFPQFIGIILDSGSSADVHFKLKIPLNQNSGGYTQTITFTSAC